MGKWLKPYTINDFNFHGAYCFSSNNNNFLLGKNGCSIIINNNLLKNLTKPSSAFKLKLIQHGLADINGKNILKPMPKLSYHDKITYFIIDITKACNFSCIYCFRDFKDKKTISKERIKDICDYILSVAHEQKTYRINIQMWGGEPLKAVDCIYYVKKYFADTDIYVSIDIESNGSLITDDIARQLYEWNIHIGISIDGCPEHQNKQRRLANGRPSMEMVKKGIKNIQKYYGNNFGCITVITKYNHNDIIKIIEYFIFELGIHNIKFNIVRNNTNAKEENLGLSLNEIQRFAETLCDVVEAYNVLGVTFSEGNLQVRYDNLISRSAFSICISNGCQGGNKMISIDMYGNIYPCEMIDYPEEKIGSIYDEKPLSKQIAEAHKEKLFFKTKEGKECLKCPWHYFCGGGCTSRVRYTGKFGVVDEVECTLNKTIYPKIIKRILDAGN